MIIKLLLDCIFGLFSLFTSLIDIPDLPPEMTPYLEQLFEYMEMGAGLLANYMPFDYVMILFGVVLSVDIGIKIYHFVMWVIRKIPVSSE